MTEVAFTHAFGIVNKSPLLELSEFGVYTGGSLETIINSTNKKAFSYLGFDSFEGLPQERNDRYNHKAWKKGDFNASKKLSKTPDEIASSLQRKYRNMTKKDNVYIQKTWFCDIIFNPEIMKKAIFVNIDCDTYTSTCESLDFLFKNDLVDEHTIFRFDDWGGTPEFLGGESKGLVDKCKEYNFKWEILMKKNYGGPHAKTVVKVAKIQVHY